MMMSSGSSRTEVLCSKELGGPQSASRACTPAQQWKLLSCLGLLWRIISMTAERHYGTPTSPSLHWRAEFAVPPVDLEDTPNLLAIHPGDTDKSTMTTFRSKMSSSFFRADSETARRTPQGLQQSTHFTPFFAAFIYTNLFFTPFFARIPLQYIHFFTPLIALFQSIFSKFTTHVFTPFFWPTFRSTLPFITLIYANFLPNTEFNPSPFFTPFC